MYIKVNNNKINIIECNSFKTKLFGLTFKKKRINYGIVLNNCNAIHTFFMKQPIDVCITDKKNNILLLKENLKPNKILMIKNGYYTYELPLNTVKYLKTNTILNTNKEVL